MLAGSCACRRVTYEIRGPLIGPVTYCHCWRCRKHSGSSFGTTAGVAPWDLKFLTGEDLLNSWESSAGVHRFFARCCGSPIFKRDGAAPEESGGVPVDPATIGAAAADAARVTSSRFMV